MKNFKFDKKGKLILDNLTVGGYLYLRGTQITALPDNLTVGGSLYLRGTQIKRPNSQKLTKNLKSNLEIADKKLNVTIIKNEFVYGDKIVTHIKSKKIIGDNTYYLGKIKGKNVAINKDGTIAHGKDLESCLRGIAFKQAKAAGIEQFENLTFDSVIKHNDAINLYRIVTRACEAAYDFADSLPKEKVKEEYTIREIIEIVGNAWGADTFKRFFTNKNIEK